MDLFSLRTVIDDILLLVRNNNISESEDLSRTQIASWVLQYQSFLAKQQKDKDKEQSNDDTNDDSFQKTLGPLEIQDVKEEDESCIHRKKTVLKLPNPIGDSADNIISVSDVDGCVIQFMNDKRRHYHYFRRYTYLEPTCWYEDGDIFVECPMNKDLQYIFVTGNFVPTGEEDEEDVRIPGWMIPQIKQMIIANELRLMLNRPSDDSNNSTLASVKPHGPQDQEA